MSHGGGTHRQERIGQAMEAWRSEPPLGRSLPVSFPSGALLESLDCHCPRCDAPIVPGDLRGRMERPLPDVALFEAWGACFGCRLLTRFSFRARAAPDLKIEWRHPGLGWVGSRTTRQGPLAKGLRRLRGLAAPGPRPPTAGLRAALLAATRPCTIPGMEGPVADPIAADLLDTGWVEAVDAALARRGVRGLRPLSGGFSSVVLEADDGLVVRLGLGSAPRRPDIPEMLQAMAAGEAGPARWEIVPRVDTEGITEDEVTWMADALADRGYEFSDRGADNLGRIDGRLVVVDPGAVSPARIFLPGGPR